MTSISATSLQPARPLAGLQADDAAHDLGDALEHHHRARERDHELELPDRRAVRGHVRMLVDRPGLAGEDPTGIDQRGDAGDEEDDVQHEVEPRLRARPHRAVEKVAAHMGVLRQRIGAAQHEQRAVQHVLGVEDPGRRRVQEVALEDLDADHGHQHDDQPGEGLADPGADAVDRIEEALDIHYCRSPLRLVR